MLLEKLSSLPHHHVMYLQMVLVARDGIYLSAPRTVGKCIYIVGGVCVLGYVCE